MNPVRFGAHYQVRFKPDVKDQSLHELSGLITGLRINSDPIAHIVINQRHGDYFLKIQQAQHREGLMLHRVDALPEEIQAQMKTEGLHIVATTAPDVQAWLDIYEDIDDYNDKKSRIPEHLFKPLEHASLAL